ncbi:MAG TPA: response regulator transcription factor [Solirubrobacteraceae bacterium]
MLIADDDPIVRRLIRDVLQEAEITVVAEAEDGRDAVNLARFYRPDVVLMDVVLPGIDGLEALARITADAELASKVVMLSVRSERELALLAVRRGASGYLNKDVDLTALARAVRDVAMGKAALSREATATLIDYVHELPDSGLGMRPVRSVLTSREWEVTDLLCEQHTIDGIADTLVLSAETVRTHVKNIMRKLEVHSRAELIAAAERLRTPVAR